MKLKLIPFFLFFIASLITLNLHSQNHETEIKIQGMDMAKAMLRNDFDEFIKYIDPRLIEKGGGKEKMRGLMDTLNAGMKKFGAEIKKVTIGHPYKVISYKKELQSSLPQTTEIKFLSGLIVIETTLIAISEDQGKHWYFIDTSIYQLKDLKNTLPDLSPDLVIPPRKEPKIIVSGERRKKHRLTIYRCVQIFFSAFWISGYSNPKPAN